MKSLVQHYRKTANDLYNDAHKYFHEGSDDELLLCCLKLRMCLESLAYEKVVPFYNKLDLQELRVWQPRQLISFLTKKLEPYTNQNSSLRIYREDEDGKAVGEPILSKDERVLTFKEISGFYDKLGAFLHTPTLAQTESGEVHSKEKIERTCSDLLQRIEEVLESTLYSSPMLETHTAPCHACQTPVICYVPYGPLPKRLEARCRKCDLKLDVLIDVEGNSKFAPQISSCLCVCGQKITLFSSDLKEGKVIECEACGSRYEYSTKFYSCD